MNLRDYFTAAPEDDGSDVVLYDGGTIRDLVRHLADDPDADVLPDLDRIDTLIAVIAAQAPLLAQSRRYGRCIHLLRYQEDCAAFGLDCAPVTRAFERRRVRENDRRETSWVWSEEDGPVLAVHAVRFRGRVTRYLWSREGIMPISQGRRAKLRKQHRRDPVRTMSRLSDLVATVGA